MITGDFSKADMKTMAHITRYVVDKIGVEDADAGMIEADGVATNKKTTITEIKMATAMEKM